MHQMGNLSSGRGKTILGSEQALRSWRLEGQCDRLEERFSVLVWNVQKQSAPGFAEAFQRLAPGRQLLLLQEVYLGGGLPGEFAHSGHGYEMAASFLYPDGCPTGVAIGSTAVAKNLKCGITEDVEPVVGTPKAFLIAQYCLPSGQTLVAATIHAINRADWTSRGAFERQLETLVEYLLMHQGPMILAGDFNTQSNRKIACLNSAAERLKLVPVVFEPDNRTLSKLTRHPLDHVLVRGITVTESACWIGGSDHAALTFSAEAS